MTLIAATAVRRVNVRLEVSFTIRNEGPFAGDEVAQVYLGAPREPPAPMALRALAGFVRVGLEPGEERRVTVPVGMRQLSYWSEGTHGWAEIGRSRPVYVGSSSRDLRLVAESG